tara:strand:+ start:685 stop:954 length:270 start_codon:yes stop_codon:yes gene_type:complete
MRPRLSPGRRTLFFLFQTKENTMIESVIIALIRQAALLTKPQQEEFTTKAAEALATLIKSTETGIDDELVRQVGLPVGGMIITKLTALV